MDGIKEKDGGFSKACSNQLRNSTTILDKDNLIKIKVNIKRGSFKLTNFHTL